MLLTQVVPRLGPRDGVGDYATRLGRMLQERHGVASRFVEAGGPTGRQALATEFGRAETSAILLHYVGYGYARRGAPLWLPRALQRARPRRLGVVFHELYATGRPWQSSFWLSGLQQSIAKRLARDCAFALLTREANRRWLDASGVLTGKPVRVLPIPSGVGEPDEPRPLSERPATLVIWGSAQARDVVYRAWSRISALCRTLAVATVVDIGPPTPLPADAQVTFVSKGLLPEAELSDVLLGARFGLLAYPAAFLGKSSIFAAYAAHGLVPIVLDDCRTGAMDQLVAGENFLRLSGAGLDGAAAAPEQVARAARAWYATHPASAHADAVMSFVEGSHS